MAGASPKTALTGNGGEQQRVHDDRAASAASCVAPLPSARDGRPPTPHARRSQPPLTRSQRLDAAEVDSHVEAELMTLGQYAKASAPTRGSITTASTCATSTPCAPASSSASSTPTRSKPPFQLVEERGAGAGEACRICVCVREVAGVKQAPFLVRSTRRCGWWTTSPAPPTTVRSRTCAALATWREVTHARFSAWC